MRFSADYDSEEEEFPVDNVSYSDSPGRGATANWNDSSDSEDDLDGGFSDVSSHLSPRANIEAWRAMTNKSKEIGKLNALNAKSAAKSFRSSLVLEDLEAVSVADFLRQLSLDDEGRQRAEEEEVKRRNADVLEAIAKAIEATKSRAEAQRRREEEEERRRQQILEQERQRRETERLEKERAERERVLAAERAAQAKKEAEAKAKTKKEAEERRRREEAATALASAPSVPAIPSGSNFSPEPAEQEFNAHLAKIEWIKENVLKSCSENPEWKKACFELKRKITSRLGQLTNSRRQISRLVKDIIGVFDTGNSVSDKVLLWLLNFFSKQVVKQAESEVVVQTPSAYPLAFVCVYLMSRYSQLKEILLARFAKNCPWTVPYYEEPKTEEKMKLMGYKRTDEGKWEETTRYIERQSGIFAVWVAMTTHRLNPKAPSQEAEEHPFPLSNAWRWAARTLNHRARNEIECAMMATFLEVGSRAFLQNYERQGRKIILLAVSEQWIGGMKGPAVGRLEIMKEDFQRTGKVGEEGFGAFVP